MSALALTSFAEVSSQTDIEQVLPSHCYVGGGLAPVRPFQCPECFHCVQSNPIKQLPDVGHAGRLAIRRQTLFSCCCFCTFESLLNLQWQQHNIIGNSTSGCQRRTFY